MDLGDRAQSIAAKIPRIFGKFDPNFKRPFETEDPGTFNAAKELIAVYLAQMGHKVGGVMISCRNYIENAGIPLATAAITGVREMPVDSRDTALTPIARPLVIGAKLNWHRGAPVEPVGFVSHGEIWTALSHGFQFRALVAADLSASPPTADATQRRSFSAKREAPRLQNSCH